MSGDAMNVIIGVCKDIIKQITDEEGLPPQQRCELHELNLILLECRDVLNRQLISIPEDEYNELSTKIRMLRLDLGSYDKVGFDTILRRKNTISDYLVRVMSTYLINMNWDLQHMVECRRSSIETDHFIDWMLWCKSMRMMGIRNLRRKDAFMSWLSSYKQTIGISSELCDRLMEKKYDLTDLRSARDLMLTK